MKSAIIFLLIVSVFSVLYSTNAASVLESVAETVKNAGSNTGKTLQDVGKNVDGTIADLGTDAGKLVDKLLSDLGAEGIVNIAIGGNA